MVKAKTKIKSPLSRIFILFVMFYASQSLASAERRELFLRTGYVSGSFSGADVQNGKFVTNVNMQAEFWLFQSPMESWNFQFMMAEQSDISRSRYFGAGIGERFFLLGDGLILDQTSGGDFIHIKPSFGCYAGWDANLVQFLVLPFGDVLASYATMGEVGGVAGIRKPVTANLAIDANVGYYLGYSLSSSVSVATEIVRVLVGAGFSF